MARATSAGQMFVPAIVDEYEKLGICHPGVQPTCLQCQLGAEAIFQKLMSLWESFLVDVITDHIEGRPTGHYQPRHAVRSPRFGNRIDASNALLSTRRNHGSISHGGTPALYLLLHDPGRVIDFVNYWMPSTDMEEVFRTNAQAISNILKIRHGLSHGTSHAQAELRSVLLTYAPLRTYQTVGEFLLDRPTATRPDLWIDVLIEQICRFATAISP